MLDLNVDDYLLVFDGGEKILVLFLCLKLVSQHLVLNQFSFCIL